MKLGSVVKKFTSKKGNDVIIRYPQVGDLDDMLKFANGLIEEDTFVLLSGKKITRKEEGKYLRQTIKEIREGKKVQLVATVNGKFAGNCEIRRGERRKAHTGQIGIALANKFRDEGIGTQLLQTLIEEGKRMKLRLLVLNCMELNSRALHVYEKLGFKKAGVIPGAMEYKGEDIGEVCMYLPL